MNRTLVFSDSVRRPVSGSGSIFLLLACFLFLLPSLSEYSLGIVGIYALSLVLSGSRDEIPLIKVDLAAFLLAFFLVLGPVAGSYTVTVLVILFLIHAHRTDLTPEARWLAPLLLIFGIWAAATFYFEFDPRWFEEVLGDSLPVDSSWLEVVSKFIAISDSIANAPPRWYSTIAFWVPWYCGALLVSVFSQDQFGRTTEHDSRRLFNSFVFGLIPGILISAWFVLWQLRYLGQSLTNNQSEFWNSLNRVPATFSDPNAFGIFGFLSIILLCAYGVPLPKLRRIMVYGLGLFWATAISYSGSRSFLLGLLLFVLMLVLFTARSSKRGMVFAVFAATTGALIIGLVPIVWFADVSWLPQSFKRALATISPAQSLNDSLFSRLSFLKIDLAVWKDHFLLGTGWRRFTDLVPVYSSRLGLDMGLWSDNPNSFYLGLLAETGILGFAALVVSAWGLRWQHQDGVRSNLLRSGLIAFLVLLVSGPHLDFEEVMVAASVLIGSICVVHERKRGSAVIRIAGLLACVYIPIQAAFLPYGLFAWEKNASGYFRWSQIGAQFWINCGPDRMATLNIRSAAPDLAKKPQVVEVDISGHENLQIELNDSLTKTKAISCVTASGLVQNKLLVRLRVNRGWIPSGRPGIGDSRLLGVQVVSPEIS